MSEKAFVRHDRSFSIVNGQGTPRIVSAGEGPFIRRVIDGFEPVAVLNYGLNFSKSYNSQYLGAL